MNSKTTLAILVLSIPGVLLAQDSGKYQCTHGDLVRRVEIYTEPGTTVPCEVHYYKDTEAPGESQVLWSAQAEAGYCEAKTEEFVARLEGWGWSCSANADVAPAPEAEPMPDEAEEEAPAYDDTDVLSPGNPDGG